MKVDISINPKTLDCDVVFEVENFKSPIDYKNSIAIICMVAGDFSLDPELEVEDLEEIVASAIEKESKKVNFYIGEGGVEADFA